MIFDLHYELLNWKIRKANLQCQGKDFHVRNAYLVALLVLVRVRLCIALNAFISYFVFF